MLIFDVPKPSKIVPKSIPKRLQKQLYDGYPLGTLKNTIFDVKMPPRWTPQISDFFQKSIKKSSYFAFWSKMPLGDLQELPKSHPRASQEPSKGSKRHPGAFRKPPCSLQESFGREGCCMSISRMMFAFQCIIRKVSPGSRTGRGGWLAARKAPLLTKAWEQYYFLTLPQRSFSLKVFIGTCL